MARIEAATLGGDRPWAALGLVVGPMAFVSAWAVGGARTPGYDPVADAISRIAAVGAPQRTLMTAGFVAYGVAVGIGSTALARSELTGTWGWAAVNASATLAVAALPLERSETVDLLHGVAATTGYVSITILPVVAARSLRRLGRERAAVASLATGAISAACLAATTLGPGKGALQRTGLLAGDVWLVATGIALWRSGRDARRRRASSTT
ncbi:MAG TPA: DUF998 domain-containing protein [Aquihabitans sp.]|nr:DUF998 domain-containing protein [Aquihabitans sp.]